MFLYYDDRLPPTADPVRTTTQRSTWPAQRLQDRRATATFTHPETLAGYLVLCLAEFFGGAWLAARRSQPAKLRPAAGRRRSPSSWWRWALYLTGIPAAFLALALVAAGATEILAWRRQSTSVPGCHGPFVARLLLLGTLGHFAAGV